MDRGIIHHQILALHVIFIQYIHHVGKVRQIVLCSRSASTLGILNSLNTGPFVSHIMVSPSLEAMLLRFMLDAHFIGVRKATFSIFHKSLRASRRLVSKIQSVGEKLKFTSAHTFRTCTAKYYEKLCS